MPCRDGFGCGGGESFIGMTLAEHMIPWGVLPVCTHGAMSESPMMHDEIVSDPIAHHTAFGVTQNCMSPDMRKLRATCALASSSIVAWCRAGWRERSRERSLPARPRERSRLRGGAPQPERVRSNR